MIAVTAKALYSPINHVDRPLVLIDEGAVVKLGSRHSLEVPLNVKILDFGDSILAPGMVDIHVHGAAGFDVMQLDEGGPCSMEQFLTRRGVTSYFSTTIAAPWDATLIALERLATQIERAKQNADDRKGRAQPLGIHLEGPFLSHARRGVHPVENLLLPSLNTFDALWQAARGHIALMTIAPELEGSHEVIAEATRRGVCVSLGHSDAGLEAARLGVAAGARHATHTFNAMRPLSHREPGILGEILTNPALSADVIADGMHVNPVMVKLLLNIKGCENTVLITDAISATGMPDGHYQLGPIEVELKDGRCLSEGKLAGSVLTMDCAVRNVMEFAQWDLQQSLRAATLNPARVAGAKGKGVLEAGADADLIAMTAAGEVVATIIKGQLVQ
jgi:N-acetylglucosamine-6-phosphate deacetylase